MTIADSSDLLHVIRLHGPWELQPLAHTRRVIDGSIIEVAGDLPAIARQKIPADWSEVFGRDFRGRVLYLRRFGKPTGLDPRDRQHLCLTHVDAFGSVRLNNEPLGEIPLGGEKWRVDVTDRLQSRNLLAVEIHLPRADETSDIFRRGDRAGLPGGLIGEVRLEIRRPVE